MLVLDASAVVEWSTATAKGALVGERMEVERGLLACPHLLDVEVLHALRRLHRLGSLDAAAAGDAITRVGQLRLVRIPHWLFARRIWDLRDTVSAYDAAYVAIAEALGASLLTCDARLGRSHGHAAAIEVL